MKCHSRLLSLALIFSMVLGPISGSAEESSTPSAPNTKIAPGFLLQIFCREDQAINGDFQVGIDGKITLPYSVSLPAAGQTAKTFEEHLEKTYQPYFKATPNISVVIKKRQYGVQISGLVKNPGVYLLNEHSTLDEALAMANVKTEDLPNGFVLISRGKSQRWISLEDYLKGGKSHDLHAWVGGEQILFQLERPETVAQEKGEQQGDPSSPSARKVQVLGEVQSPGGVSFRQNANGYYYMIQRGGPTKDSDLEKVVLLRKDAKSGEPQQYSVGPLKDIQEIHESDILLVHPDRPSELNRALQNTGIITSIVTSVLLTLFVVKENKK